MRSRAAAACLAILALSAAPATAGTEARPELSDAGGDQEPQLPAQTQLLTRHTDVLAAWIDNETRDTYRVTLRLAQLSATSLGTYNVVWLVFRNQTDLMGAWGVRARLNATGPEWTVITGDPERTPLNEFADVVRITGELAAGEPGHLRWSVPRASTAARDGDVFFGFFAAVYVENPTGDEFPPYDLAENRTNQYAMGVVSRFHLADFSPPPRPPDVTDPPGDATAPYTDLTGAWMDFDAEAVRVTLRLASFDPAAFAACAWSQDFRATDYRDGAFQGDLAFFAELDLAPGSLEPTRFGAENQSERVTADLHVRTGAPGFVRVETPRAAWTASPTLRGLSLRAQTACLDQPESLDVLEREERGLLVPGPAAAAAVAAALAPVLARVRRR